MYDEYYEQYICPNNQLLKYTTTNRKGYQEYKSHSQICQNCSLISRCTEAKNKTKVLTLHVWIDAIEKYEEIRYTLEFKELYKKETIERVFGTA